MFETMQDLEGCLMFLAYLPPERKMEELRKIEPNPEKLRSLIISDPSLLINVSLWWGAMPTLHLFVEWLYPDFARDTKNIVALKDMLKEVFSKVNMVPPPGFFEEGIALRRTGPTSPDADELSPSDSSLGLATLFGNR